MAFNKDNKIKGNFSRISIGLASPEEILDRSSGEVLKPETVNYRTYKPERDGLFCERIFGPSKDYECHCGKYKRIRYRGIICDRCGVEVTEKKVRRERMGHISLTVPVAHIWYFRSTPNKIGSLLGIASKKLESVIYYERYVVINAGAAKTLGVKNLDLLSEEEYLDILDQLPRENQNLDKDDPEKFVAGMGAEAIYTLLAGLNLDELSYELRHKTEKETSQQRKAEALKRLSVIEAFRESKELNRPEWMIMKVIPVIPPDLRPLVPLDGGRFATSDLNDLYRRVIIRNNRLKRLIEIKAPEVILRNEKRMLQEAVDSLFDNSRKSNAVKSDANRTLKSLSDSLKGKQGRFRQNLLGKRVDYSARSVIVVGPELKMHECGLPKYMAAELYKPFIIRKLIERGIVKTVRSAKKIVDKKEPVIWDILENVMKGHPVLLNRAPTLHRLGIQAFQPKLIEGKAIQLHPLACTAFNADFDGDQMAVHLPLGNAAVLEAQLLMLGSHNILNPANGAPITVPSQDMVLGLYYITKKRAGAKGEGMTFYGPEEVIIAYNENRVDLHAKISVRLPKDFTDLSKGYRIFEDTTVGRVIFNQVVPKEVGYINELLTKKSLRDIISKVVKVSGVARTAQFLDDIKSIGYTMAFKGGLSFNLGDVIIPKEKAELVEAGYREVESIQESFNMGLITNNERYNQTIDIWTTTNSRLTNMVTKNIEQDQQGFNPIFMMLDSGARGSKEQIRQLCGMRGLMAKPQKSGSTGAEIIENPILSNFKEGLSVLEYFISTHGARKGLADTALKTADAGYLTRRLVDVSHDVIINEEDCKTLRGIVATAIKNKDEIVESLYDRILGRTSVHDIYNPLTGELILPANEEITEEIAAKIQALPIEQVEIRSVLTCESKKGVCAKCYGRNLATGRMVEKGEVVGVIAAQSIGEPGTQLTLRTFHVGGTASSIASESEIVARYDGRLEFEELRTITKSEESGDFEIVIGRTAEMRIVDVNTGITLSQHNIPYGAKLYHKNGDTIAKGDKICEWDAYNAVTIAELPGIIKYDSLVEGVTYREEAADEFSLHREKVVIESRDKSKNPTLHILQGETEVKQYNLPVGAHIMVENGQEVKAGEVLVKIPRAIGKSGDITGGLPRVTELFEARNPSNPAIVAEINGEVQMGKIKRGNREIIIKAKSGEEKRYLVPLSKQILVQENDYIRAGMPLSDGAVSPADILAIQGPIKVQEYIVNEIQEVYRMQGVKINDKHFEIIVRQMMRKVEIVDPGDTRFLPEQLVDKWEFNEENNSMFGKKVVQDAGDSQTLHPGQIVTTRRLRDENSMLKRQDLKLVEARDAVPATSNQILQGITRAALRTNSFMSAASFQETTKVLSEAAIRGKVDTLEGLKENVICGHLIPAGTGQREFERIIVASKEDYLKMTQGAGKKAHKDE
ncbi:MAG: DNA-directed RNA polymerase subunit beta' [Candidatus Coprenecus sp.]|nr:DNA-directed RNA polymerase subunit beta' [Candidatus Coprenecus sp.]